MLEILSHIRLMSIVRPELEILIKLIIIMILIMLETLEIVIILNDSTRNTDSARNAKNNTIGEHVSTFL